MNFDDRVNFGNSTESINKVAEVEALLEGAIRLHEASDHEHELSLIYIALDKIRSF